MKRNTFDVSAAMNDGMTREQIAEFVKANKLRPVNLPLNTGQKVVRGVADMLPALAGTAGMISGAGVGGAATLPAGAAGSIPGAMMGGAAGAGMGAVGQRALYGLAGIPTEETPLEALGGIAGESALGIVQGGFGGVGSRSPQLASPVMKVALGHAQPGTEATLVREGIEVSPKGLAKAKQLLATLGAAKRSALAAQTRRGGYSWKTLEGSLLAARRKMAAQDVVSDVDAAAMGQALKTLRKRFASRVVGARTSSILSASGQPVQYPGRVVTPPQDIPARRLEAIRRWADLQVKGYERARKGQSMIAPSPLEGAYQAIADEARNQLNKIPAGQHGTVGDVNARLSALIDASGALRQSLTRSSRGRVLATVTGGMAGGITPAAVAHDPRLLALGIPAAMIAHSTTNPVLQSRLALSLNNPRFGMAAMSAAPRTADTILRLLGAGQLASPADVTATP